MYKHPVLLNSITHNLLRIGPVKEFGYARDMNSVVVVAQEFSEMAKQYPVLFSRSADGSLIAVAIMGLHSNLFIDDAGTWTAGYYVPAFIRRYPFILAESNSQAGSLSVCIDSDYAGFSAPEGNRLFTDDGENTAILNNAIEFLRLYQSQYDITRTFVNHLETLKVFKAVDATITLTGGDNFTIGGLLMVDEDALQNLPDSELVDLFRKGYLPWIYAHLYSMTNFNKILSRMSNVVSLQTD